MVFFISLWTLAEFTHRLKRGRNGTRDNLNTWIEKEMGNTFIGRIEELIAEKMFLELYTIATFLNCSIYPCVGERLFYIQKSVAQARYRKRNRFLHPQTLEIFNQWMYSPKKGLYNNNLKDSWLLVDFQKNIFIAFVWFSQEDKLWLII